MSQLEKAYLENRETHEKIEFMFNPTELAFSRTLNLNYDSGARTDHGLPKVSFAYPQPYSLRLTNILFDTRESGENVLSYVDKFKETVQFSEFRDTPDSNNGSRGRSGRRGSSSGNDDKKRPPTYLFCWGEKYLNCFVKSLSYKLTLFMPNGMPVRAVIELELEEVDEPITKPHLEFSAQVDRSQSPDSLSSPPEATSPIGPGLKNAKQQQPGGGTPAGSPPSQPNSPAAPLPAAAGAAAGAAASQATEAVSQVAEQATAAVAAATNQATEAAGQVADQAAEVASEAVDQATEAASEAATQATEAASAAAEQATETASQAAEQATDSVDQLSATDDPPR